MLSFFNVNSEGNLNSSNSVAVARISMISAASLLSKLSQLGFEMMLFYGGQLKTNGVYFQDGLNNAEFIPGYLFEGFKYQYSRDNQHVPFVKFENGVLTLIAPE